MIFSYLFLTGSMFILGITASEWVKPRQFLIYPATAPTRLQFIGGIGIPVEDLAFESVTSGYVLKAEYFLPTNSTEVSTIYLKPQDIKARRSLLEQEYMLNLAAVKENLDRMSSYRWILYRAVEMALERNGYPGHVCVLKSICEHAELPLHHDYSLLGEILHVILTPSTSRDTLTKENQKEYRAAEKYGRNGGDCNRTFGRCRKSPLEHMTTIFEYK